MNRKQRRAQEKKQGKQVQSHIGTLQPKETEIEKKFVEAVKIFEQERYDIAAQKLTEIIKQKPDHFLSLERLGFIARKLGNFDTAINLLTAVTEIKPTYAIGFMNLSLALKDVRDLEGAKQAMFTAHKLDKNDAQIVLNIANFYLELGDKEKAEEYYFKAYEMENNVLLLFSYLNQIHKFKDENDPYLKELKKIERNKKELTREHYISLHYILSKAYRDIKDYSKSFDYLMMGCNAKRQSFRYDVRMHTGLMERTQKYYTKEFVEKHADKAHSNDQMIFVVGMPRSGSTLIDQILCSHRDVQGIGESPKLPYLMFRHAYMMPAGTVRFPSEPTNRPRMGPEKIAEEYLNHIPENLKTSTRIVDKALINYAWIGMIKIMFPNAKIIHATRHPLDCCISCLSYIFSNDNQLYTYDITELGKVYQSYRSLMAYWHAEFPGEILDVNYEDIIENQEKETKRILDHLELPWDDNCLEFYKTERHVKTASLTQVRQPIYKSSAQKWKLYGDKLVPLIKALGPYAPEDSLYLLDQDV